MRRITRRLRALYRVGPQAWRETLLGAAGMGLALLITGTLAQLALGDASPWLIAPMGATALLLFFVPASPLVQPWAVLGGNILSALIGVALHLAWGQGPAIAALAGALSALVMFALRCLHPPGVAVALTAVLGGPDIHRLGWGFALVPVATDSVVMVLLAILFNGLAGRRYPYGGQAERVRERRLPGGLTRADVDAALASFGEPLDIDGEDLEEVLHRAELNARRRWAGK